MYPCVGIYVCVCMWLTRRYYLRADYIYIYSLIFTLIIWDLTLHISVVIITHFVR